MRVVVNDIVAVPQSGGVYSILEDFYKEACKFDFGHEEIEWIFILSNNFFKETRQIKIIKKPEIKKSWFKRLKFELFSGRKLINELNPDIYISLQNTMTLGVKAPQKWTYLHQPLPYQKEMKFSLFNKSERKLWIYKNIIGKIINLTLKHGNTNVIVQTQWMKDAVLNRKIVKAKDVYVLPPKIGPVSDDSIRDHIDMSSFFYPATGMVYKNHKLLFKAADILEKKGYRFNVYCTLTNEELNNLNLKVPKSVNCLGRIPREEVMNRYKTEVLVFPSLIETFGLPILEAAMSNDFIIIGDTSFGREILADYRNKVFFDAKSVKSLVKKMESCINGEYDISDDAIKIDGKKSVIDLVIDQENNND